MVASRNVVRLTRGAPKRLGEMIRAGVRGGRTPPSLDPIRRLLGIEPISKEELKPEWATIAKYALSVREDEYLRNTFAFFGLDPDDPLDWRVLAANWAYVLFGRSRAGRPGEWTDMKYCALMYEVGRRKQLSKTRLSDRAICAHIANDRASPAYFRKAKKSGVRKALQRARSEKYNGILRGLIDQLIAKSDLTRAEARDIIIRAIEKHGGDKSRA